MTEIVLNEPQIMAAIGKIEATRMAQHVWPDGWQASAHRIASNQVPSQWLTALEMNSQGRLRQEETLLADFRPLSTMAITSSISLSTS